MSLVLNSRLEIKESPIEGRGLFARVPIKGGEKFKVVEGEHPTVIMTDEEFKAYIKTVDYYDAVALSDGTHKVGTSPDEDPSNFGNHSCNPNIVPKGDGVVALRDIDSGEEITIDYAQFSTKDWEMKCNCGTKNCNGTVRGNL